MLYDIKRGDTVVLLKDVSPPEFKRGDVVFVVEESGRQYPVVSVNEDLMGSNLSIPRDSARPIAREEVEALRKKIRRRGVEV